MIPNNAHLSPPAIAKTVAAIPNRFPAPNLLKIPEDRLPILVTGVSGVTGYNAFYYLHHRYPGQVIGQRPLETFRLVDEGIVPFNLEDQTTTLEILEKYNIRSVLSCGGNCALKACELDPLMAEKVNVGGATSLAKGIQAIVRRRSIRLVHLSIDLVFSGNLAGGYCEEMPPDPVTVYGQTMVQGERLIQEHCPEVCLLRISLPMGVSFNGHAGAIDWIQSRFAKGRPATLYYDEVRTPTYVQCLNRLFEFMLADDITGLFHAGSSQRLSLFEIAQVINRVGGYDPHLLKGCYRLQAGPIPPRAGNVAMNCEKLERLLSEHPRWSGSQVKDSGKEDPAIMDWAKMNWAAPWPCEGSHYPDHRNWHFEGRDELDPDESPWQRVINALYQRPS